jgi:hypothetical protein
MFNDLNQPNQPTVSSPVDDIFAETEKTTEPKKTISSYSGDSEIETKQTGVLASADEEGSSSKGKIIKIVLVFLLVVVLLFLAYLAYAKFFVNKDAAQLNTPVIPAATENKVVKEAAPATTTEPAPTVSESIIQGTTTIPSMPIGTTTPPVSNLTDSDGDGLTNEEETVLGTNPNLIDTDNDGLSDYEEVKIYNSNPLLMDTDNDSLSDYEEIKVYKTDPKNSDTDGDAYKDGDEIKSGYNPLGAGKLSDQLK